MLSLSSLHLPKLVTALAMLALLAGPAAAVDGDEMFADPQKETRARDIGRQLRCLVCQNQSIFDSNSGLARDLRVLVRQRMDEGDNDEEILSFISNRYGDYVLLKPRFTTKNAILWITPALALVLGIGSAGFYLRGRKRKPDAIVLSEDDRDAARKLLQEGRS